MKKLIVMITGAVMLFSSVAMANAHHINKTVRVQAEVVSSTAITQQVGTKHSGRRLMGSHTCTSLFSSQATRSTCSLETEAPTGCQPRWTVS